MENASFTQNYFAQQIVKEFLDSGGTTFDDFLTVWKNNNGSKIHSLDSPRPLVFGRCQSAFSTFVGLIVYKKQEEYILSGFFGLYLTYRTQNLQVLEPILVTAQEYSIIISKSSLNQITKSIIQYLSNQNAFVITAKSYAIVTPNPRIPPKFVNNERPAYYKIEETKAEKIHRAASKAIELSDDTTELEAEYGNVMDEIFGNEET